MLFTIKRPASKRYFQLGFYGFKPAGRNKIEQFLKTWGLFIKALTVYLLGKLQDLFNIVGFISFQILKIPTLLKSFLIKKLIWSRGKLGRFVATSIVMGVFFGVFMFGEVFNSSVLVVDQPVNADLLSNVTDIIPKKEVALTTLPETRQRTEYLTYKVEGGDTLYSIGNKFKVSVDALKYVNSLTDSSVLKIGQDITVPPASGLIHKIASGDTLNSIAQKYGVASQAIADFNYLLNTSKLSVGTELVIPGAKIPQPVVPINTYLAQGPGPGAQQAAPSKNFCVWPSTVRIITQYFSWYHNGLDVATPAGGMPPLFSCTEGTVIRSGWDPFGLGLHVRIDHGNGYETIYGHMSRLDVSYGEKVDRGQMIGLMGSTGNSTGPHVHFIVKYKGVAQNPLNYMN